MEGRVAENVGRASQIDSSVVSCESVHVQKELTTVDRIQDNVVTTFSQ